MVLGVDIIIDMIRTMTNVTGSSVVELIVSSLEKSLLKIGLTVNLSKILNNIYFQGAHNMSAPLI